MDQNNMSTLYSGPSKDASYKISVHLAKWFQRRRFFQKSTNQKQESPVAAMFVNGTGRNEQTSQRTFQGCFLPHVDSFGQAVSDQKIFQKSTNQKQKLPVAAMFVNGSGRNEQFHRGSSIHASYLVSVHLAKRFQMRRIFRNQPIRHKNCMWWPCLLMDRDEMINQYRGPSIDTSYQVSVHLGQRLQRRRFLKISQSETRIVCGGHVS